jgi:hypothetical protein
MFSLGTFQRIFVTNFFLKKWLLCAFVCPSWFKETGGLHNVRRSRAPISIDSLRPSVRLTRQFRILISPRNWLGQSNSFAFLSVGRTGQGSRSDEQISKEGHGFYFFIFLKQIDGEMNRGFTFFVLFFLTFKGGRGTWVYSIFFSEDEHGFYFFIFQNKLRKENGVWGCFL